MFLVLNWKSGQKINPFLFLFLTSQRLQKCKVPLFSKSLLTELLLKIELLPCVSIWELQKKKKKEKKIEIVCWINFEVLCLYLVTLNVTVLVREFAKDPCLHYRNLLVQNIPIYITAFLLKFTLFVLAVKSLY